MPWVSLIAGLDSPLEHETGLFDWNVGLDYRTGTLSTEIHLPRMPETSLRPLSCSSSGQAKLTVTNVIDVPLPHFRFEL